MSESVMTPEKAAALREPFPQEHVGLLPRVTCKECSNPKVTCQKHQRAKCGQCGAYVSTQHIHLDYVGHGAVTDRLLKIDPNWSWEPLAFDQATGMPTFIYDQQMRPIAFWIKLTVCGVERLGVGTCESGQHDAEKVLIGDALRNAAMRFGVALDLWIKGQAEDSEQQTSGRSAPDRPEPVSRFVAPTGEVIDLWPGEMSAKVAKDRVVEAASANRDVAAAAWTTAGLDGRLKVTESELETALGHLRESPATAPPPGEVSQSSASAASDVRAMVEAEMSRRERHQSRWQEVKSGSAAPDPSPEPPALTPKVLAIYAGKVFGPAADKVEGVAKSEVVKRLRYALTHSLTDGRTVHLDQLTEHERKRLREHLHDIESGDLTFDFGWQDSGGVTFAKDSGGFTVHWAQFESAEVAS